MRLSSRFAVLALAGAGLAAGAQATVTSWLVDLNGLNESPPNASPGFGDAQVQFDDVTHMMHIHADFAGLLGTTTASHIHAATAVAGAGTAGVATTTPTFAGFPLGVTAGTYDNTLNMLSASSYNPSYVTANGGTPASAETAFFAAVNAGKAYLNIHTSVVPGGEIRGFLRPAPEPTTAVLLGVAAFFMRRR